MPLTKDGKLLPRRKKQSLFVICSGSKQREEADTQYIATDGSPTTNKTLAARFWTFWGAKKFAEVNHIDLNPHTYIDREIFTECEIQG